MDVQRIIDENSYIDLMRWSGAPKGTVQKWKTGERDWRKSQYQTIQNLKDNYRKEITKMKNLKVENLMNTYANEDETMDLEFQFDGKKVIVRNVEAPEATNDEFYWDDEKNVQKAIEEADEEDIEEVE